MRVLEVQRPNRQHRRRHGESDPADAVSADRTVQAGEANGTPKVATGSVGAIPLIGLARRRALETRTQAANQLHAVVTTAPDQRRARLTGRTHNQRARRTRGTSAPPGRGRNGLCNPGGTAVALDGPRHSERTTRAGDGPSTTPGAAGFTALATTGPFRELPLSARRARRARRGGGGPRRSPRRQGPAEVVRED
jgi:hypothetical protein